MIYIKFGETDENIYFKKLSCRVSIDAIAP
jgi:hypothetical protein